MQERIASDYLILTAGRCQLTNKVETHLREQFSAPPLTCLFSTAFSYIGNDAGGLLVIVVDSEEAMRETEHLVQDLCLRRTSCRAAVVYQDRALDQRLAGLSDLIQPLAWPDDAERLDREIEESANCPSPFIHRDDLPLDELLQRELLENTPSLEMMAERIALAAEHDITVLLTGATGSGKTHCARFIHEHSARRDQHFLQISCGALAANLVESEFFGHVRGAFTGADRDKEGKFSAVGGGTLLLDEIDTLSLKHQAALLRVMETGEFEPVGGNKSQQCQARILVASNIPLEEAVDEGAFRADLYFRLNVMSFHFPGLRERLQDIAPLARCMVARYNRKFNKGLYDISPQALKALEAFSWPGNIRQLENVMQHAVLIGSGPELLLQHLPEYIQEQALNEFPRPADDGTLHRQRDISERNAIQRALVRNGYNRSRTAEELGISRVTLYKKMEKYGLSEIPIQPALRSV